MRYLPITCSPSSYDSFCSTASFWLLTQNCPQPDKWTHEMSGPIDIMSGRCNGQSSVNRRTVPCFCPQGSYQTFDTCPEIMNLICICRHPFHIHDSSPVTKPAQLASPGKAWLYDCTTGFSPGKPRPCLAPSKIPETFTCHSETVVALWDLIQKKQIIHIRGTLATGKSTLTQLLQHHVSFNNKNDLEVYYIAWPVDYDPLEQTGFQARQVNQTGLMWTGCWSLMRCKPLISQGFGTTWLSSSNQDSV